MSLSARTPTGFDTAGFVPELWAQKTVDEMETALVAWDASDHSWETGKAKGDTINIPVINNPSVATEVVVGSKATSDDISSGTKLQIIMDKWYEKPIDIDTMSLHQTHVDWESKARKKAAYAINKMIDYSITSLYSSLYGSSVQGSDGSEVTDDLLIALKQILDEADVPVEDGNRFLIVDPSVIADMMQYDKFVSALYVNIGAVANGTVAKNHPIYACTVRMTNNLAAATTGAYAAMIHREAIASALQLEAPWVELYKELHQLRIQHEALWGVLEVRDTFGVPFYTRHA